MAKKVVHAVLLRFFFLYGLARAPSRGSCLHKNVLCVHACTCMHVCVNARFVHMSTRSVACSHENAHTHPEAI